MGNKVHPVAIRLGKTNFWKSELYSYYYTNAVSDFIKLSILVPNLLNNNHLTLIHLNIITLIINILF